MFLQRPLTAIYNSHAISGWQHPKPSSLPFSPVFPVQWSTVGRAWWVEHGGWSMVGGRDTSHLRPSAPRPLIAALTEFASQPQPSVSAGKEPLSPRLMSH